MTLSEHIWNTAAAMNRSRVEQLYGTAPCVVVQETVLAPTGVRVACGTASYARCLADVFESGVLTIMSIDNGATVHKYPAGYWVDASQYGLSGSGDVDYRLTPGLERR